MNPVVILEPNGASAPITRSIDAWMTKNSITMIVPSSLASVGRQAPGLSQHQRNSAAISRSNAAMPSLRKMIDRFYEHPATVLVVTNMYYTEAPWLTPKQVAAATSMEWHEAPLTGSTSHEFGEQIAALEPFLAKNWQARHSPKTGNPAYDHTVALVIYRDDYRFLLENVIPRRGEGRADYDMVIASQPYRARAAAQATAEKGVVALGRARGEA